MKVKAQDEVRNVELMVKVQLEKLGFIGSMKVIKELTSQCERLNVACEEYLRDRTGGTGPASHVCFLILLLLLKTSNTSIWRPVKGEFHCFQLEHYFLIEIWLLGEISPTRLHTRAAHMGHFKCWKHIRFSYHESSSHFCCTCLVFNVGMRNLKTTIQIKSYCFLSLTRLPDTISHC